MAQLRELAASVDQPAAFRPDQRSNADLMPHRGMYALFIGPPGTGKTMAAQILARELDRKLLRIDPSSVVSKYIGETEKNLARLFTESRSGEVILLLDEADALFGNRTEVRDSDDRYANLSASHLLQRIEAFEGLVIVTTNSAANIDAAFRRRARYVVEFPYPDAEQRKRIWQKVFPAKATLGSNIDYAGLAARFRLNGKQIRNAALIAAKEAAERRKAIGTDDVIRGIERERKRSGKAR